MEIVSVPNDEVSSKHSSNKSPIPTIEDDENRVYIKQGTCTHKFVVLFANLFAIGSLLVVLTYPILYAVAGTWMPFFSVTLQGIDELFTYEAPFRSVTLQYSLFERRFTNGYELDIDRDTPNLDTVYIYLSPGNVTAASAYYDTLLPDPLRTSLEPTFYMTLTAMGISSLANVLLLIHLFVIPKLRTKNGNRLDPKFLPADVRRRLRVSLWITWISALLSLIASIVAAICFGTFWNSEVAVEMRRIHERGSYRGLDLGNAFRVQGAYLVFVAIFVGLLCAFMIADYSWEALHPGEEDEYSMVKYEDRHLPRYNNSPMILESRVSNFWRRAVQLLKFVYNIAEAVA